MTDFARVIIDPDIANGGGHSVMIGSVDPTTGQGIDLPIPSIYGNGSSWYFKSGTAPTAWTAFASPAGINANNLLGSTLAPNVTVSSLTSVGTSLAFGARSVLQSPADGQLLLTNAAGTDFSFIQFGGTTSAFPALRRTGARLDAVLADGSAYAAVNTGALSSTSATISGGTLNYNYHNQGSTEVLPAQTLSSPFNSFGGDGIFLPEAHDMLYGAASRFGITTSAGGSVTAGLFDGTFSGGLATAAGATNVITIDLTAKGEYGANGMTYPDGYLYVTFYYTNVPASISARAYVGNTATWYACGPAVNVSNNPNYGVYRISAASNNYVSKLELTVVAQASISASITSIQYIRTRPSGDPVASVMKGAASNRFYGTMAWFDSGNVQRASVASDGTGTFSTVYTADVHASRTGGTTGAIYFGNSGSYYLYFDGTQYNMPGGALYSNGSLALTAANYNGYAPTLTGVGASGTWGINITGTAPWGGITGKPTTLTGYGITDAAALAGAAFTGAVSFGTRPTFGGNGLVATNDSPTFGTVNATTFNVQSFTQTGTSAFRIENTFVVVSQGQSAVVGINLGVRSNTGVLQVSDDRVANASVPGPLSIEASSIVLISTKVASPPTDFSRLMFGGTTNAYSALRRNGAGLDVVLADNSAFTTLNAGDIHAIRSATSGAVYFGTDGVHYLFFDGTQYNMPSGLLYVNGALVMNTANIGSYAPTLTGGGASGTWAISVSGNAATASAVAASALTGTALAAGVTTSSLTSVGVLTGLTVSGDITRGTAGTTGSYQIQSGLASPNSARILFGTDGSGWKFSIGKNQGGTITDLFTVQDNATAQLGGVQVVTNSGTWAIGISGLAANASLLGGNAAAVATQGANSASTIVQRDGSGHIYGAYAFMAYVNTTDDVSTGTVSYLMGKFGDNYHRSVTAAKLTAFMAGQSPTFAQLYATTSFRAGATDPVSTALVAAVVNGNGIEFGHANAAGYRSTFGAEAGTGRPFLAFSGEAGTTSNTYRTRGIRSTIIQGSLDGGLVIGNVATAAATDNQGLAQTFGLSPAGDVSAWGYLRAGAGATSGTLYLGNTGAYLTFGGSTFTLSTAITVAGYVQLSSGGYISLNRSGNTTTGLSFYTAGWSSWQQYMAPAGTAGQGVAGTLTPPTGTYVTSWAMRSIVEPVAGYGWAWESGASTGSYTPTLVMELTSGNPSGFTTPVLKLWGDMMARRTASTGVVYFGDAAAYIYYNGTNFDFSGKGFTNAGTITATDFVLASDLRLKRKLTRITSALDRLDQIVGYTYELNADPGRRRAGVIAQDVAPVLPEAVDTVADGMFGVSYDSLVPLLIEGLKELRKEVAACRPTT